MPTKAKPSKEAGVSSQRTPEEGRHHSLSRRSKDATGQPPTAPQPVVEIVRGRFLKKAGTEAVNDYVELRTKPQENRNSREQQNTSGNKMLKLSGPV